MNWYYGIILWFGIIAFASWMGQFQYTEIIMGEKRQRYSVLFAFIVMLPLVFWASQRMQDFGDTAVYMKSFQEMPNSISGMKGYLDTISKDTGFYVLSVVIKICIGNHVRIYFFIIALLQAICVISLYRKYSSDYVMAIFIFVTCLDYFSYMQNGVRQFTAVAILLFATPFLLEKKYARYILLVLLASTMHQSALLMIPIALIVQGKAWNIRTIIMLIVALIAVTFVGQFTEILDNLLSETQYTNVVNDWQQWQDDGTNPFRVMVFSVPTLLSIFGYKYIKAANDPVINMATNMSIVCTGLYVISMFTSGIFIGRLPIYASMYSMGILLPWEIYNMFTKESVKIVKLGMIVGFISFYYYQIHYAWGVI